MVAVLTFSNGWQCRSWAEWTVHANVQRPSKQGIRTPLDQERYLRYKCLLLWIHWAKVQISNIKKIITNDEDKDDD